MSLDSATPDGVWAKFKQSFHDSEVILFARLQVAVGSLWLVLVHNDLSPWLTDPKVLLGWSVLSGFITEAARRNRATFTDADDKPVGQ